MSSSGTWPSTRETAEYLFVKNRSRLMKIDYDELLFIEALKDYVVVHTPEQSFTIHSTMKDVENKLNERRFMRVHRSYIVNLDAIHSIKYSMIESREWRRKFQSEAVTRTSWLAGSTCCESEGKRRHRQKKPRAETGVFCGSPTWT